MWIPVLIIVLVAAMAVGPILWFRSTPYQRRIIQVRNRASQLGLRIRLITRSELGLGGDAAEGAFVAGYGLDWVQPKQEQFPGRVNHQWCLLRERISHEGHFAGWWNWQPGRQADPQWHETLRTLLPQLPEDAVALESNQQGLWLYWEERGKLERVDQIASLLRSLRQHGLELSKRRPGGGD